MSSCAVCKQEVLDKYVWKDALEFPFFPFVDTQIIVCSRCRSALLNVQSIRGYFKFIQEDDLRTKYEKLLKYLCQPKEQSVGLLETPAGRRRHHSYSGGLVCHIVQMIEFALEIYDKNTYPFKGNLHKEDIVIGCFIHDLHKACNTFTREREENQPPFRYLDKNKYLTADLQSIKILMDFEISLTEQQLNALVLAEGIWSDSIRELEMSKLAVLVNMADMYSSLILKK